MIARWGFDLDMSAVRLVSRDGEKWSEVATEKIDGPDIEERLMALVDMVEPGAPVTLFLPRDQILYTEVEVSSEEAAQSEIEKQLKERTPYQIDELVVDWLFVATDRAKVAAIAKETLDEAAAFAEARGLKIASYGSLADETDFPRNPSFQIALGPLATEEFAEPAILEQQRNLSDYVLPADAQPSFSSSRQPSASADIESAETNKEPVLRIEDDRPVMEVAAKPLPPLDPGVPINQVQPPPRVRTDVAAGSLSGAAASLKPGADPISIHTPQSRPKQTLIILGIAAALTIGIAAIVWSVLPLAPRTSETGASTPVDAGEIAADPEVAAASSSASPAPELPQPIDILLSAPSLVSEGSDPNDATSLPALGETEFVRVEPASLPEALPDSAFSSTTIAPLEKSPVSLTEVLTAAPSQGLDGSEDALETTLDIYFASVEEDSLALDAIALPREADLASESLPAVFGPPANQNVAPDAKFVRVNPLGAQGVEPREPLDAEPLQETPEIALAPQAIEPEADIIPSETADPVGSSAEPAQNEVLSAPETPEISLRPTSLAAALPDRKPPARPQEFLESIERNQFGGRTRSELARVLPRERPASPQSLAQTERPEAAASPLAVQTSLAPRARPEDFDALVATAILQARERRNASQAEVTAPDTSAAVQEALASGEPAPESRSQDPPQLALPSNASVSRQATVEDALRLNRINLVGVYGVPSDRRALVRLPSGRYVKVKVGDRVDGGTVAQINDDELLYRKGNRTLSLAMPQG